MAKSILENVLSIVRAGTKELNARSQPVVEQVAESVGHVLDEAGTEGVKIKKALIRSWTGPQRYGAMLPIILGGAAAALLAAAFLNRTAKAAKGLRQCSRVDPFDPFKPQSD